MPVKSSRCLVIDASVIHSSGGEKAVHPTSKHCRDFLQATLKICHRVVLTEDISKEWKRHQSKFAMQWRVSMFARKKLVSVTVSSNEVLHNKIERVAFDDKSRKAMLKDMLLIEAAMATDRVIVSLDEIVRNLFGMAATSIGELRAIVWVNPDKTDEECISWLERGAKAEKKRCLGAKTKT